MILKYEGYTALVGYEDGDDLMHGSVVNARAVLHFAGRNIDELKIAFADTIADYQEWCQERGVEPEGELGSMKTKYAPFRASDHFNNEEVIAEYLTAAAEDENSDVLLSALAEVARARSLADRLDEAP